MSVNGCPIETAIADQRRPRHSWLDIRWITASVILGAIVFLLWNLLGPEPAILVSRETTFITEPLAADGLPDYPAAVLAMAGPAPRPEENAAAAILQVSWPMGIEASDLPAVCAALGIANKPPIEPLQEPHEDSASKVINAEFVAATELPWKATDLPQLAGWLERNKEKVDALVAASELPCFWLPSPPLLRGTSTPVLFMNYYEVSAMRTVMRILACRAMWHGGEGRIHEAWLDASALLRLARLLSAVERGPQPLVTYMVASRMAEAARSVLVHAILSRAPMPPGLVADIRREFDRPEPALIGAGCIRLERLGTVDCLLFMGPRNRGKRAVWGASAKDLGNMGFLVATSLDWNIVLEHMNRYYDAIETASRIPEFALQQATLKAHESAMVSDSKAWSQVSNIPMLVCNRGARSVACAGYAHMLLTPSFSGFLLAGRRSRASFALARTATALAVWRIDQGDDDHPYPEKLADLVPRYLAAVPADPFSDKPLVYECRGDGYVLASVGANGVFDGGDDEAGWIIDGEWRDQARDVAWDACDLVIRMPVPEREFVPKKAP